MLPLLPGRSGYGKGLRGSGGLLAGVITELARDTASWPDRLRLVDFHRPAGRGQPGDGPSL